MEAIAAKAHDAACWRKHKDEFRFVPKKKVGKQSKKEDEEEEVLSELGGDDDAESDWEEAE